MNIHILLKLKLIKYFLICVKNVIINRKILVIN